MPITRKSLDFLAQEIIRVLSRGDQPMDSQLDKREVVEQIKDVANQLAWTQIMQNKSQKVYQIPSHFLVHLPDLTIQQDATKGKDYVDIGAEYLGLPRQEGIQRVQIDEGNAYLKRNKVPKAAYKVMHMVSNTAGYAASNQLLIKTNDGGRSWTTIAATPGSPIDIQFVTEQDGYLLTASSIYTTTDGGFTWSELVTGFTVDAYKSLYATDNFLFVGGSGLNSLLLKYDIENESWSDITLASTEVTDIFFVDDLTGFIATTSIQSQSLYYTEDGGQTFTATGTVANSGGATAVWFNPFGIGYYAGDATEVWRSEDFGKTWTNISDVGQQQVQAIIGSGDFNVAMATNFGTNNVYFSRDGGTTWEVFNANSTNLIDIGFNGRNFLVPTDSMIYTISNNKEEIIPVPLEFNSVFAGLPVTMAEGLWTYEVVDNRIYINEKNGRTLTDYGIATLDVDIVSVVPYLAGAHPLNYDNTTAAPIPPEMRDMIKDKVLQRYGVMTQMPRDENTDGQLNVMTRGKTLNVNR